MSERSVFDNAETEFHPESTDPGNRSDNALLREMYADIKVLKNSVRPLVRKVDKMDDRVSKIERTESKVRGGIAMGTALGTGGLTAWLTRLLTGGN